MTDDDGLVAWLTERLDEDEAVAREADNADDMILYIQDDDYYYPLVIGPGRVLADVAAKRAILALHRQRDGVCLFCTYTISSESGRESAVDDAVPFCEDWPCDTVRHLAAPYADQPGYRPEWAVGS